MSPRDSFPSRGAPVSARGVRGLGGFGGFGGGPPRDLAIILATLFVTFSLQFFASTRIVPALLRLTPFVWRAGFVWQLFTYPFIGNGGADIWILIDLLMLFWFGRDVFAGLGRKHFWRLVLIAAAAAGVVALGVDFLASAGSGTSGALSPRPLFPLLQGQFVLLAIFIAAFATANRTATIRLFFVLPVEARWFLLLEILFAFIGYLNTRDAGGFAGICAAVGLSYLYVRDGGFGRGLRQTRLRAERWWLQKKLERSRRRSGLRVVKDPFNDSRGPWTH